MFTGIIEEKGKIKSIKFCDNSGTIEIAAKKILDGTKIGDSIAVNGVCLTVVQLESDGFCADVMAETLRRSNLASLSNGNQVNLERAMSADGRFGGHIVSGHIDGIGKISRIEIEGNASWIYISCSEKILSLIVEKGSIAIDGISLTVAKVNEYDFAVSIIPHTFEQTTLSKKQIGNIVNLENDIVGKYIQRFCYKNSASLHSLQQERDKKILDFLCEV